MQVRSAASVLGISWALTVSSAFAGTPTEAEESNASVAANDKTIGGAGPGVRVDEASDEQKRTAQESFLLGDKAFDIQEYEQALKHFVASYETVASPNSRLMIARSLLEIGRLDEAYDEYSGVMEDAEGNEDYETTGSIAKKEREALRHRLAWLTIKMGDVPDGSSLTIGGRERATKSLQEPMAVTPGRTLVKATTADGGVAEATAHLAAGRSAEVELRLGETITVGDPPPSAKKTPQDRAPVAKESTPEFVSEKKSSLKPFAYVAGGVGIVGLAGFGTFGVLSSKRYAALESDCMEGRCPPSSQSDIDSGKQMQLFANVSLGVGVAGVATGVLLLVLDGKKKRPLDMQVGYKSVMLSGEF